MTELSLRKAYNPQDVAERAMDVRFYPAPPSSVGSCTLPTDSSLASLDYYHCNKWEEVDRLAEWCDTNNLLLNAEKTKEIIVDFRRNADSHPPLHIKGTAVERVNSFKFLGVHISEDLTWTTSCSKLVKKAHQRLFFLRTLRRNQLSSDILVNFYRCTIESILTNCITAWYGCCSATDRKALQRVVKAAQRITGTPLPAIEDIYRKRCLKRAGKIIKESSHPAHTLFTLLPSGRRYRSLRTRTTRYDLFSSSARTLQSFLYFSVSLSVIDVWLDYKLLMRPFAFFPYTGNCEAALLKVEKDVYADDREQTEVYNETFARPNDSALSELFMHVVCSHWNMKLNAVYCMGQNRYSVGDRARLYSGLPVRPNPDGKRLPSSGVKKSVLSSCKVPF
ncbi:hypothetical protein NFI96_000432 [Prochilodus magdalenae]|nr:hypothetical protein NFI96_000432 [Prochilodus magdalenae]